MLESEGTKTDQQQYHRSSQWILLRRKHKEEFADIHYEQKSFERFARRFHKPETTRSTRCCFHLNHKATTSDYQTEKATINLCLGYST